MKKIKLLLVVVFLFFGGLIILPNISNATVDVKRIDYSNNENMRFEINDLELDKTHQYKFGITTAPNNEVDSWYLLSDFTTTSAIIDFDISNANFKNIINTVDIGYLSIKDVTSNVDVLKSYSLDLKIPYLNLTNYMVIENGKVFFDQSDTVGETSAKCIKLALRGSSFNGVAYYQYEKITDESIISKYKDIKNSNGDFNNLKNMLSTNVPESNWKKWEYFNHYSNASEGYPQKVVSVPDNGLYYMWVYFAETNYKNLYGYILVDNLENITDNQTPEVIESNSLSNTSLVSVSRNEDETVASSVLPKTGVGLGLMIILFFILGITGLTLKELRKYRDI